MHLDHNVWSDGKSVVEFSAPPAQTCNDYWSKLAKIDRFELSNATF